MKPLNLDNRPCSPISSNCVIWQGGDISCINLCSGDTVSDVVFKLATELCIIMDQLNVSNYDLSCLAINSCPPADFQALIQLLITKICEANGVIVDTTKVSGCPDCVVSVAPCFVEGTQTTMQLVDYVQMIANRVCSILDQISIINNQITNLDIRVTVLENTPPPVFTLPSIPTGCLATYMASLPSAPIDQVLDTLLNNSTIGYCSLIQATGLPADILSAVASQCISATDPSLAYPPDNMSTAYFGSWVNTPVTASDAITNLWIAICDIRTYLEAFTLAVADTNTVNLSYTAGLLTANMQDTGWIPLEGFDFMAGAAFRPYCRRIGNVIHFKGVAFVPMGNTNEGGGGTVIPFTAPDDYNDKHFGYTYNTLQATGASQDAMLLKKESYTAWTIGGEALIAYFHREQSVIPTGILGVGETIDGSATVTGRVICERVARSIAENDIAMTTVLTLGLGTIGTLFIASTNFNDIFRGSANCVGKTSLVRQLCTQAISGENIPTYISTDPSQFNATAPGPYQAEIFGSGETYDFNQDSTRAEQLGGFGINLSGLTAYVDNCSGLTPTFINC